jgi:hypothetical protein
MPIQYYRVFPNGRKKPIRIKDLARDSQVLPELPPAVLPLIACRAACLP